MELGSYRQVLGSPAYEDDDVLIYHADSLDLMRHFPAGSTSLTVTSPPYNIGKAYESKRPLAEYVEWTKSWTSLVHDLTAQGGAFWLNLGYMPVQDKAKALPIAYLVWDVVPFFLVQEVVWNYGAGVAGRLFFSPRNEKLLWYVKDRDDYVFNLDDIRDPDVKYPNQKKNGKLKCNPLGKNPSDVWQIAKVTSGKDRSSRERTPHPAQFPVGLIDRVIRASSNKGDVIFDPFAGSGSALDAAVRAGRKAIGIEINTDYVEIAAARLRRTRREIVCHSAQRSFLEDDIAT